MIKVEAVADDEFVFDDETDPTSIDGANALPFFTEKNTDLDGAGAEFFGMGAGTI